MCTYIHMCVCVCVMSVSMMCVYVLICTDVYMYVVVCMNHFYGRGAVETGPVYRRRPLGVHLSLKSWTLWSTREGGERTGVPEETTRVPLES